MARTVGKDAPINMKTPGPAPNPTIGSGAPRFTGGPIITTPAPEIGNSDTSGPPRDMGGAKLNSPSPKDDAATPTKTAPTNKLPADSRKPVGPLVGRSPGPAQSQSSVSSQVGHTSSPVKKGVR